MSRLWNDRIEIALAPQRIALVRRRRFTDKLIESRTLPCLPGEPATPWQGALEVLRRAVAEPLWQQAGAQVVLSNHFIRYAVVARPPAVRAAAEQVALVKHRFNATFGAIAQNWVIRTSQNGRESVLAAAVDQALIDGLRETLRVGGVRITSMQPLLMAAFNRLRNHIGQQALWYVLLEPGKVCIAGVRDGIWLATDTQRCGGNVIAELPRMIEQTALSHDVDLDSKKVIVDAPHLANLTLPRRRRWQFIDAKTLQRRRERSPVSVMKMALG